MPSIDYAGDWFVVARPTCKVASAHAGIRFPVKASRLSTAEWFAEKEVLDLLPGWTVGTIAMSRKRKHVKSWVLRR